MAPRFTKLPLTAHTLASGDKGPRPITLIWPRVAKNRGHILYLYSQIARTLTVHHLLSREAIPHRALRQAPSPSPSPSPIVPPSTKFGSPVLLCHRTAGEKEAATVEKEIATVAPPSSPRCGLRRATFTPPLRPSARHRHAASGCVLFCAYVAPSVAPFVVPLSPHFATVPHNHHLATSVALLLRVTAPASILRLVRHFQPLLHRQFCPG